MAKDREIQAMLAMAFAALVLITLIVLGDDETRRMALLAALLGCVSQFAGQEASRLARAVSIVAAYAGFALTVWAIFTL